MGDGVTLPGTGALIATDEVVDGTLGTVQVQYMKIMDGTLDGTTKAAVGANGLKVDGSGATQPVSGTFFQATQPVSGTFFQGTQPVSGTFFQATQPVSGTFFQTTQPSSPVTLALTDGSTTITLGGTAQSIFAAAAVVTGYEVVNPDATEDLWISDTTTALANGTGSIRLAPGGGAYTSPDGMRPTAALSVVAATTGHKFTARRW